MPPKDFDRDPIACLARLRDEYGDVCSFAAGRVLLARPEWTNWAMARSNSATVADQTEEPRQFSRPDLIRDHVETWMAARRTAQWHRLGRDVAERTAPAIRLRLREFMDASGDSPASLTDCQLAVLDAAGSVFVRDLEGPLRSVLISAADLLQQESMASFTLPYWLSSRARRRLRVNTVWIEALVAHVGERRAARDAAEPPSDLLDLLLDARDDDRPAFTDLEVAQALSINLGNLYTVGGTGLAWLLTAYGEHDIVRPEAVGAEDWARAVVKETLRLYPSVALTSRILTEDAKFGDVTVPAGDSVFLSPLLLHTDPRWWREDPSRFDPTRWLAEEVHDPHAYLPYGAGPRICTGVHISNAVLESAADLLANRAVTGNSGLPRRRWGSVTQPRKLRVRIGRDTKTG
ncbi:cytochrome P450 [Glycomyces buryatensis]|uniref:Cytochrome P450 n=1 Tax=Glycomyces buryatensis TaxID=2570927 RepID=A0A4V4HS30_9ACTN|nr:cytochrome P450 [Glycomyces buryatensis]THV40176.1 cytochrome P450 [Glycomyces buryatensis]